MSTLDLRQAVAAIPVQYDRVYSRCKLATDPLYGAVWDTLRAAPKPELPLLDIGCGMGLLAFYLRSRGFEGEMVGLDYDPRKTGAAGAVVERLGLSDTSFFAGDARSDLPPHAGHVTILDILQFMTREEQRELLVEAAGRVAPGGLLVIRSGLAAPGWRFRLTVWMDFLARAVRWMKDSPTEYPDEALFREALEPAGLQVKCEPMWGKTPFHNYLITATRDL